MDANNIPLTISKSLREKKKSMSLGEQEFLIPVSFQNHLNFEAIWNVYSYALIPGCKL